MIDLWAVAFLGGFITGISPCIVPVVPIIAAGGATGSSRIRPLLIIVGLIVSFSLTELLGSSVLSALHLPQNFLYWLGIALLFVLAIGLMIPIVGEWIERPFAQLGSSRAVTSGGGLVLGLSLGLVFVPCAGPVLAAISVAAANHRVSGSSLVVTLFYTAGAAVPLLVIAFIAQRAISSWQVLRAHLPLVRRVAGALLGVTALVIAFGLFDPLQRAVPGYTSAFENHVEGSASITKQLQSLSGEHANSYVNNEAKSSPTKRANEVKLPKLGPAPNFTGIVAWLNTPGEKPLSLAALRGKVVLIDFWTYSCINCQRSLPHVEAWYSRYHDDGFVVVGVHTPEFAFEHVVSNVRSEAKALAVDYPVAVDNNYATWDVWGNQYWPAEYLIDPSGEVRAYDFGEGNYSVMETNIRALLGANGITRLPPRTDVANKTPTAQITQESYLGYAEEQYGVGTAIAKNREITYRAPVDIPQNAFAFSGAWTNHSEEATAGQGAGITLHFTANDVYLVMGGTGVVNVSFNGTPLGAIDVRGVPKLYTLYSGTPVRSGLLKLTFAQGVQAYDFTFG